MLESSSDRVNQMEQSSSRQEGTNPQREVPLRKYVERMHRQLNQSLDAPFLHNYSPSEIKYTTDTIEDFQKTSLPSSWSSEFGSYLSQEKFSFNSLVKRAKCWLFKNGEIQDYLSAFRKLQKQADLIKPLVKEKQKDFSRFLRKGESSKYDYKTVQQREALTDFRQAVSQYLQIKATIAKIQALVRDSGIVENPAQDCFQSLVADAEKHLNEATQKVEEVIPGYSEQLQKKNANCPGCPIFRQ